MDRIIIEINNTAYFILGGFFYSFCMPDGQNTFNRSIFHDIRRVVKIKMIQAQMNDKHIGLILGHTLPGMSERIINPDIKLHPKEMQRTLIGLIMRLGMN